MDLQDKTVLVTGASSGIGKAIAIAFARKRANVLVHYGRNQKGAQDTLKEVEKYSGGRICQADLMEGEQISALLTISDEPRRRSMCSSTMPATRGLAISMTRRVGTTNTEIFCWPLCA